MTDQDDDRYVTEFVCAGCGHQTCIVGLTVCPLPPRCGVCTLLAEHEPVVAELAA